LIVRWVFACAATMAPAAAQASAWLYPNESVVAKVYVSRFEGEGYFDDQGEVVRFPFQGVGTYDSIFGEISLAYPERWNFWANAPLKTATYADNFGQKQVRAIGDLWMFAKRQMTDQPLVVSVIPAVKAPTAPKSIYGNRAWELGLSVPVILQTKGSPLQLQSELGLYAPLKSNASAYAYAQVGAEAYFAVWRGTLIVRLGAQTERRFALHADPTPVVEWYWIEPYAGVKYRFPGWWEAEVGIGKMTSGRSAGTGTDVGFGITKLFSFAKDPVAGSN